MAFFRVQGSLTVGDNNTGTNPIEAQGKLTGREGALLPPGGISGLQRSRQFTSSPKGDRSRDSNTDQRVREMALERKQKHNGP